MERCFRVVIILTGFAPVLEGVDAVVIAAQGGDLLRRGSIGQDAAGLGGTIRSDIVHRRRDQRLDVGLLDGLRRLCFRLRLRIRVFNFIRHNCLRIGCYIIRDDDAGFGVCDLRLLALYRVCTFAGQFRNHQAQRLEEIHAQRSRFRRLWC